MSRISAERWLANDSCCNCAGPLGVRSGTRPVIDAIALSALQLREEILARRYNKTPLFVLRVNHTAICTLDVPVIVSNKVGDFPTGAVAWREDAPLRIEVDEAHCR